LGVLKQVRRRRFAAVAAAVVMSIPAAATANPLQEETSEESSEAATDQAVVEIDVDVAEASPDLVAGALADVQANVATQLAELQTAQGAVDTAVSLLADKAAVVEDTQLRLEQLTLQMDEVVVGAFIAPPGQSAIEVLNSTTAVDATVKQTMLDLQADENANVLADHEATRSQLEEQQEQQEAAAAEAEAARADAEAALADLQAAVDQQTQFILDVQARLADPETANNPALQSQTEALAAQLQQIEDAEAAAEAAAALRERQSNASASIGWIVCPVDGEVQFTDTWGAARSGGRSHKGTDMMAASGTPTVAPVSGRVEHRGTSLGGLSWYVYGHDGDMYYGTHLSSYENQGAGVVEAGTVIGYVGSSGNASASAPHLHFEEHPGGGAAINSYPLLDASCPSH
jgi:murein DD-endopeptidase MepM/ murein hydrolase activator NlpD